MIDPRDLEVITVTYDSNTGQIESLKDVTNQSSSVDFGSFDGSQGSSASEDAEDNLNEQVFDARGNVVRDIRAIKDGSGRIVKYVVTFSEYSYFEDHVVDPLWYTVREEDVNGKNIEYGVSGLNKLQRQAQWQSFEIEGSDPRPGCATPRSPKTMARSRPARCSIKSSRAQPAINSRPTSWPRIRTTGSRNHP